MATAGGTSSSKKKNKKRHSAPVVSSTNTITYGPPQPTTYRMPVQQPGYPVQPMQPGVYAPAGYPLQPPGVYPAQVPGGGVQPMMMIPANGAPMMAPLQRPPQPQQQPSQRQLDFDQAMSDFKGMFPKMDKEVIETVLRSNSGKVDETIDQLLKLNADMPEGHAPPHSGMPPSMPPSTGMPLPPSQLPPGFMSDSFPDQPPPYSPPEPDSPFSRFNSNSNAHSNTPPPTTSAPHVPVSRSGREATTRPRTPPPRPAPRRTRSLGGEETVSSATRESYRSVVDRMSVLQTSREWNPPVIGNLPSDFLRLSVSGEQPASSPSSATPASQTRVAPGIQQRLDENSNRRRSLSQNDSESNQMLEDEKLALMLQNEEFLRQLQQDPEFLSALERDYHESLRDGKTPSNPTPTSPGPPLSSPPPLPSQPPLHRQPPPNMATRPLPATPTQGPELPARPPGMRRETSGSSLSGGGGGGSRAGMTNGTPNASGGLSVEDIEFRNKLNHMGKSSKTTLSLLAGKFQKKKKASRKYEAEEGGATDALLGGESLYEELNDNEMSHEVYYRKSSKTKKRHSFGRHGSLLRYEDKDPHFFSR